ncbi:MAG: S-layer homology domain-containing protein [Ruminococcaceae bacterium]|nr:S-layer homology domain-containing protein [Oscillospiraceae bacterium]
MKKVLSIILCIVLVMSVMPLSVFAATDYGIFLADTKVTSDNADDVFGDGTVRYDPETATLTLAGYNYEGPGTTAYSSDVCVGMAFSGSLNVRLLGENSITMTGSTKSTIGICNYSASTSTELTFIGDGSLTIKGDDMTSANSSAMTLWCRLNVGKEDDPEAFTGSITAIGGNTSVGGASTGIYAMDAYVYSGSVTAVGGNINATNESSYTSCGFNGSGLRVCGGKVTAVGGKVTASESASSNGVRFTDNGVKVTSGTLVATAGYTNGYSSSSIAISSSAYYDSSMPAALYITGGTVIAQGGEAVSGSAYSQGVYGSTEVSGGALLAKCGTSNNGYTVRVKGGIRRAAVNGWLKLDGSVIAEAVGYSTSDGAENSFGLCTVTSDHSTLSTIQGTVNDVSVYSNLGSSYYVYPTGMLIVPDSWTEYAGNFTLENDNYFASTSKSAISLGYGTINLGDHTFLAANLYEGSDQFACALSLGDNTTVTGDGGQLIAVGPTFKGTDTESYGIRSNYEVAITGNVNVTAVGGCAENSYGYNGSPDVSALSGNGQFVSVGYTTPVNGTVNLKESTALDVLNTSELCRVSVKPAPAPFFKPYNVYFGGIRITTENMGDITAALNEKYPDSASGTATFTPATDTSPAILTLDNFSYTGVGGSVKNQSIKACVECWDDIIIDVSGDCTFRFSENERNTPFYSAENCDITVTGSGTLNLLAGANKQYNPENYGMYVRGNLTVSGNATLNAVGADALVEDNNVGSGSCYSYGAYIMGNFTLADAATVTFSTGEANGNPNYAYCYGLNLSNSSFNPVLSFADGWSGSMTIDGWASATSSYVNFVVEGNVDITGIYTGGGERDLSPSTPSGEYSYNKTVIIKPSFEKQPLWVGGVRVTEYNYDDVLGDGTVSYDKETCTLTLNNTNIESKGTKDFMPDINGIQLGTSDDYNSAYTLNIKAIGTNTVKGASVDNSYPTCGIYSYGGNNTINIELVDGATLNLIGGNSEKCQNGSYGINPSGSTLNVTGKGTLNAAGGNVSFYSCTSGGIRLGATTTFEGDLVVNTSSGTVNDSYAGSYGILCSGDTVLNLKGNVILNCNACPDAFNSFGFNNDGFGSRVNLSIKEWKGTMTCTGAKNGFTAVQGSYYNFRPITNTYLNVDDYIKTELYVNSDDASPIFSGYSPLDTDIILNDTNQEEYMLGEVQKVVFNSYKTFPDVPAGSWYYDAVKYCAVHKFVNGYGNGNFGPNDALQRQDFVVILANIAGADLSGYTSCKLTDVQMSAYYGKAVAWAVDKGIIAGYQNGKFGVGDPITREQVATILYRYMGSPTVTDVDSKLAKFPDKGNISEFAKVPLAWAVENNIISGMQDGTAAPKGTAVRAQIASIIMRMDRNGMFNA